MLFSTVLTIVYLVIVAIIGIFVVWHSFETKNIYEKIIGAVMLVLIVLRLLLIK